MNLFLELLQVALTRRERLSHTPNERDWQELFYNCQKQTVAGLTFEALDGLSAHGQKPPLPLLYEWIGLYEQIKQQNLLVNRRCVELVNLFSKAGFETCILKGQGNAMMYPNPLARQAGDIDIWINGEKEQIISFVRKEYPQAEISALHVDFPIFEDVNVEVHFTPTYSITGRHQRKLSRYIEAQRKNNFCHAVRLLGAEFEVNIPANEFNVVFQLSHMQRHFFYGGIGFRQIVDFYYLLCQIDDMETLKNEIQRILPPLGLGRFASAVMWVIREVLGIRDECLLVEPDEKRGVLLLNEIMLSGNFGKFDRRGSSRLTTHSSTLSVIIKNARMVRLFPEESLSAPITGLIRRMNN